ncbi:uncharacterized protein E6C27_scaffold21G002130 [Cucumis melo var. makuwa]|uniref:Uncharacterized protein n=1 Tax=Cucumis melo var. makuwa TaxID=1194695 RepID=A0A5A7VIL8_CUCMM|nr:uncharacterized protein E6C27_scaffold21G002130 [Cucumis melo var. makuwa]
MEAEDHRVLASPVDRDVNCLGGGECNGHTCPRRCLPMVVGLNTPKSLYLYVLYKVNHNRWEKFCIRDKRVETNDALRHPANAEGWKHFDSEFPDFASDPRNVLGLALDGLNSFGQMSTSYSMWPVVLLPYNLPP